MGRVGEYRSVVVKEWSLSGNIIREYGGKKKKEIDRGGGEQNKNEKESER